MSLRLATAALILAVACTPATAPAPSPRAPSPSPRVPAASAPAVVIVTPGPTPGPTRSPHNEVSFRDVGGAIAVSIETFADSRESAHVVFHTPDGQYDANVGTALYVAPDRSMRIDYRGPATLTRPRNFLDPAATTAPPRAATIRLWAHLDPATRQGEAELSENGLTPARVYRLSTTAVTTAGLEPTLERFERLLLAADWRALFDMLSAEARADLTPAVYAAQMDSQVALGGRIIAVTRVGTSEISYSDYGAPFVTVAYDAAYRLPLGGQTMRRYEALFVRAGDGWKFWLSRERPASAAPAGPRG